MKIKYLKVYQAVEFGKNKAQQMSFTAAEYQDKSVFNKMPKVSFEELSMGILIKGEDDTILVGWPNIAYMKLDIADAKPDSAKKAK